MLGGLRALTPAQFCVCFVNTLLDSVVRFMAGQVWILYFDPWFNVSRDLMWPSVYSAVWLFAWKALIVTDHIAKFHGHGACSNWDIKYLICHVALQDYVIKGSSDFMEGSSSLHITTLSHLVAIDILVMEICFLIITGPHMLKGLWVNKSPLSQVWWPWDLR